ncbi:hypothetical protein CHUAL_008326 [Chamberlinius hualienensis]
MDRPGVALTIHISIDDLDFCTLKSVTYTGGSWASTSELCGECCGSDFHKGKLQLEVMADSDPSSFVVAVDDAQVDGGCRK